MTNKNGKATMRRVISDPPRSVALVGFGDSMDLMYSLPADVEIWTLNAAEDYNFPRIDRLFELHPLRDIVLETPRFNRLKEPHSYPIYTLEKFDNAPSSVRYPIEWVLESVFENVYLGEENAEYADSTFPYMIALAVLEGYKTIYVYGFGFRSDTEYRYQRPGAMGLIMWAAGKGAKIILPENTELLPRTLYGYTDYQSISRQNCEQWLRDIQLQESDWMGKMNVAHTKVIERESRHPLARLASWIRSLVPEDSGLVQAAAERKHAHEQMYMRAGAIHILMDQIAIMDRKQEAIDAEFDDPFIEFAPVNMAEVMPVKDSGDGS